MKFEVNKSGYDEYEVRLGYDSVEKLKKFAYVAFCMGLGSIAFVWQRNNFKNPTEVPIEE